MTLKELLDLIRDKCESLGSIDVVQLSLCTDGTGYLSFTVADTASYRLSFDAIHVLVLVLRGVNSQDELIECTLGDLTSDD